MKEQKKEYITVRIIEVIMEIIKRSYVMYETNMLWTKYFFIDENEEKNEIKKEKMSAKMFLLQRKCGLVQKDLNKEIFTLLPNSKH